MLFYCIGKPSSIQCRRILNVRILEFGSVSEIPCLFCASSNLLYVFSLQFPKCSECIHCSRLYNGNFVAADFDKLNQKYKYFKSVRNAALLQAESLNCQIQALKKFQQSMFICKVCSIEFQKEEECY